MAIAVAEGEHCTEGAVAEIVPRYRLSPVALAAILTEVLRAQHIVLSLGWVQGSSKCRT
jgi:hypothetical protein